MQKMETRSQSRSKLLSPASAANADDDDCEKAAAAVDPTTAATAAAALPKSTLAARLEKREAMKRNSMDTNPGDQESDSSDDGGGAEEEVNGDGAANGGPESDDDGDELEGEVEDLKDEDMFAKFTSEIVSGKDFPAGEFDSAKPEDDPEYELPPPNEDPFAVGAPDPRGELAVAAGTFTVVEAVSSSSGSSDSEGAAEEDDPIDPDAVPQPDVSIPGVALGEAAKRFPPFWRTKNRLGNVDAASYKSEDDPTFAPSQSELDRASDDEAVDDNDDDEEEADVEQDDDFEISEEEAAAILDGPNGAVADDDLTAVMEDLTIGGEDKADMVAPAEEQVCLVEAIEKFDPAGYDESADPDYDPLSAPPPTVGNPESAGEMDSASNDDDEEEEEGMEQ